MENKIGEATDDKKQSKIEDYLTGPRKKRKNYVILATGENFDQELGQAMESYVRKNYPQLSVSKPGSPQDLTRQFGRNISLLAIDDNFDDIHVVLGLVKALKEKRRNETIPVLFLTRNSSNLISLYHNELLQYHETDEYIFYPGITRTRVFSKIKNGIEEQNKHKNRRYSVFIPITFYHLTLDQMVEGQIVDLSLHGAVLEADKDIIFKDGDQVRINIPVGDNLDQKLGDFVKVSGRVRRVFISGSKISLSFEHMTNNQMISLGRYLTSLVGAQLQKQGQKLKHAMANTNKQES